MTSPRRASSLVEFVFFLGVWGMVIAAFLLCIRLKMTQQRALSVALWATQVQSCGWAEETFLDPLLNQFFSSLADPQVRWSWRRGRFTQSMASRFYRLRFTQVTAQFSFSPLLINEQVVIQEATE